ncbi:MAG: hypothetical protein CME64_17215 [Halobacteriovoraceae bacterium]|nr:hypothetical protein [Halobacteriovoraceae bacterium]|tara:strand:- start:266801 stop:267253 length:453 start_codon:yes stop_codon:yes gene_type:complete
MEKIFLLAWPIQGVLILFDEFYFHKRRGLKKWERIGHPIDTFIFLGCFIYTLVSPFSESNSVIFLILAVLSCLVILKDEWVHIKECDVFEHWLHCGLFLIHPISLIGLLFVWKEDGFYEIFIQSILITLFLLHQIYYWNIKRTPHEAKGS